MRFKQPGTKWCHVTLSTYRRRKLFKIAATARFCERLLRHTCETHGWRAEAVVVRPDVVQVLLEVPRATSRDAVVRGLRAAAGRAVRDGMVCAQGRRVFETGHWFAVITNPSGLAALRGRLQRAASEQRGLEFQPGIVIQ
jgi:REP element-mobilizing transposase RayT